MELTASLNETKELATKLAHAAKAGDCFCLIGDLGAGKAEFARAFIKALCGEVNVGSPTFNILQVYGEGEQTIYHFDLYRINDENELAEIGLDDALQNGICIIEWPQIAESYLPKTRKIIELEIIDDTTRKITIS